MYDFLFFYWHVCDFQLSISGLIKPGGVCLSCTVYIIKVLQPPINSQVAWSLQTYTQYVCLNRIFSLKPYKKCPLRYFNLEFYSQRLLNFDWGIFKKFNTTNNNKNNRKRRDYLQEMYLLRVSEHSVWTFTAINWRNWPWGALESRC